MLMQIVAPENTWLHQRRKRREQNRSVKCADDTKTKSDLPGNSLTTPTTENHSQSSHVCESNKEEMEGEDEPQTKRRRLDTQNSEQCDTDIKQEVNQNSNESENRSLNDGAEADNKQISISQTVDTTPSDNLSIEDIENYVVKATLTVRKSGNDIRLEMLWIDGQSKELLHQLMQLFKNKLK